MRSAEIREPGRPFFPCRAQREFRVKAGGVTSSSDGAVLAMQAHENRKRFHCCSIVSLV